MSHNEIQPVTSNSPLRPEEVKSYSVLSRIPLTDEDRILGFPGSPESDARIEHAKSSEGERVLSQSVARMHRSLEALTSEADYTPEPFSLLHAFDPNREDGLRKKPGETDFDVISHVMFLDDLAKVRGVNANPPFHEIFYREDDTLNQDQKYTGAGVVSPDDSIAVQFVTRPDGYMARDFSTLRTYTYEQTLHGDPKTNDWVKRTTLTFVQRRKAGPVERWDLIGLEETGAGSRKLYYSQYEVDVEKDTKIQSEDDRIPNAVEIDSDGSLGRPYIDDDGVWNFFDRDSQPMKTFAKSTYVS